ncbi:MAG: hypothetical protein COV99_05855 [Bacteroidetes bacterium CG12_big_fil_rev_8_21_14_0_65_60_17]|nr:MAG: hypothetical protein COV99_05855 [Bacteroidetes bacterium CG12_big_fil_rev_8_21_14_0_65_60_17]
MRLVGVLVFGAGLIAGACDSGFSRIEATRLQVERASWDSLIVDATFERDPLFGPPRPVPGDALTVTIFRANYDTLFHGQPGTVTVDDEPLFSDERLLVEVCAQWKRVTACDQVGIRASRKRAVVESAVTYPIADSEYGLVRYQFGLRRERMGYSDSLWKTLDSRYVPDALLRVYVPDGSSPSIDVPVRPGMNRVNLDRRPGFRDFRYDIQSGLLDNDSTLVVFELHGRNAMQRSLLARDSVMVRARTVEERKEELSRLVESAGSHLLNELQGRLALGRAFVFINEWSYVALERTYDAEIELQWQDGLRRRWSDVTLRLAIRFDGSRGVARLVRASSRGHGKWFSAWPDSTVFLDSLHTR